MESEAFSGPYRYCNDWDSTFPKLLFKFETVLNFVNTSIKQLKFSEKQKRVTFDVSKPKVHYMKVWSYAYRAARKG